MLRILERYITKTILLTTGLVALIITGVLFLLLILTELKSLGEGDYGIVQAFLYVLFRLPTSLYQFSPLLVLLGSIIGLSVLSSHKELAVMRASGFSIRHINMSVFYAALLLILGTTIIGEWAAPYLSYSAETRKENAKNAGQAVVTAAGVWFHVDNNFIHVQQVIDRQQLQGVTRYQFDDYHHLLTAYYAKKLLLQNNEWLMLDGVKTSFYQERTNSISFAKAKWDLKFNPHLLDVGLVEPSEMSLAKLAKYAHYLKQNGLQASEYEYEFWQRLFQPLASLIMVFLAIPFVMGALSTSAMGWRVVIGILVGFAFFISNAFLGQVCIVYQLPALFAASLPLFIFFIVLLFINKT